MTSRSPLPPKSDQPTFWKRLGAELLTPHFLITMVVVVGWLLALRGPLGALNELMGKLVRDDGTVNQDVVAILPRIGEMAALVSALFTTVVGAVIGYYFGQRGQARAEHAMLEAEKARLAAESEEEAIAESLDATAHEAQEEISELRADRRKWASALLQAVKLIPGEGKVSDDSPLGRILAQVALEDEVQDG